MQEVFNVFQDKEAYFETISENREKGNMILKQVLVIFLFGFLYGIVMGSYNGVMQAVVSGFKVPLLLFLALFICFPAFYVIQYMLGSRMGFKQMINMVLSGFVVLTTIMVSFAPIVIFFMITGNNYGFLKLLHVGVMAFSGIFGMRTMIEALKFSCEKKSVYPRIGLRIFKFWVVVFAFVGMQLAWNLRPFLGDKYQEFELFRAREGNFYLAVVQSGLNMFGIETTQDEAVDVIPNGPETIHPKIEQPEKSTTTNDSLTNGGSE